MECKPINQNVKNIYYAEDIKQLFYINCKGKIDEGTKPLSFSKWYGILVYVPQSRYEKLKCQGN